ncbi:MAG: sigma-70 family RNA polymerase sigma factor [Archangium sp.]
MSKPSAEANVVPLFALERREDDALMALARGGNREAFEALVVRHQRAVLRIAAKYLGEVSAAKDACQLAFLEIFRDLNQYRPQGRFPHYLRRVVLNQCHQAARRGRMIERAPVEPPAISPLQPDEAILAEERRRLVDAQIAKLSDKLRDVVVLRYAGEHPLEEIATILELPLGTVKSRLFSAMNELSAALKELP